MKYLSMLAAVGLLCGSLAATSADADTATDELVKRLERIERLEGSFSQTQYGQDEEAPVSTSGGRFKLLKPAYFAWDIERPDSQLVVTDGKYLWHHDRDLETVTRRPVAGQETLSPLQVLAGDTGLLNEQFTVTATGKGRFQLVPTGGNPGFRELTLVFAGDEISGMEVLDNLNQRLFIEFTDLDSAPALTPEAFRFQPPEGADLFYHEQ